MDYSDGELPNQQTTIAGGLTRYRSAPCSYLDAGGGGGGGVTEFWTGQPRALSPETESILARFMENYSDPIPGNSTAQIQIGNSNNDNKNNDNSSESPGSEMIYKNPALMNYNDNDINSMDVLKISSSSVANKWSLVRHRSSPAGLFDDINIQNNAGAGKYEFRNQISSSGQINFSGSAFNLKQNNDSRDDVVEFQDSVVACKMRAKRGHATHPRSIAERTRRGKISRRLGKLQELVPNMDKQTSTSDMLDLAVDYIKDLRNQVQTLTENQARCTCQT